MKAGGKRCALALATTLGVALLAPGAASAQEEVGVYDRFDRCPIDDPLMQDPTNREVVCVLATTNGGSLQIGATPKASTDGFPVEVQFGLRTPAEGDVETVSQPDAVQATPVPVPGGLVGITGEANLKRILGPQAVDAVNRVTATVEQAGAIANFDVTGALIGTPVFDLPVKLHLENPLLGPNCYIGSNDDPIVFRPQSGTTDPPPPNEPITGDGGTLAGIFVPPEHRIPNTTNTFIIGQEDATLVDNSFSVPKARGCGPFGLGLLDGVINQRQTLPQKAGTSEVILADNDSYLGLTGGGDELTPAQTMELLLEPGWAFP